MITTVVDVNNFSNYLNNFGEFYKNQIVNANVVLLSRVSSISDLEILKICEEIRKINKTANIITTDLKDISAKRIIEVGEIPREKIKAAFKKSTMVKNGIVRTVHNANDTFENWGTETSKLFDEVDLKHLLLKLSKETTYGKILRAKGILPTKTGKWVQFDYVPGEVDIKKFKPDYTGRLCVIGSNLNKKEIEKLFLK